MTMEMTQIRGVDSTIRDTVVEVAAGGECVINEKLMTDGDQVAESNVEIVLKGDGATGRVISRSVGRGRSALHDGESRLLWPRAVRLHFDG